MELLADLKKEGFRILSKAKAGYRKATKADRLIVQGIAVVGGFSSLLCASAAVEVTARGDSDVALFLGTGAVLSSLVMGAGVCIACQTLDNLTPCPKRGETNRIPGVQNSRIVRERLTK